MSGALAHVHNWTTMLKSDTEDRIKTLAACDCGAVRWSVQAKHLNPVHVVSEVGKRTERIVRRR